jgi:N-acetylneuraminate synthase/N,N'-diacetyllegionaminate synthase
MKTIKIENKIISPNNPVFFIAEAGVNHNGSIKNAKKLVDIAKKCGADAVKFQSFKTENIILEKAPKSKYHIETTGSNKSQSWFKLLKTQEMSENMHYEIFKYCKKKNIVFLSTPYDYESVDLLDKMGVSAFKIASTDNQNIPLLEYISKKNKPVILSTAMSTLDEVALSFKTLNKRLKGKVIILQCTGNYPSNNADSNLNVMKSYKQKFKCIFGYSDHTTGFTNSIAATAMGASVIEKHFTINKKMFGPDHRMSLSPSELEETIKLVRLTSLSLGSFQKKVLQSEQKNRKILKKSLVSKTFIKKGSKLSKKMFDIKRPGNGILPKSLVNINLYKARIDIKPDSTIKKNMIKKIR